MEMTNMGVVHVAARIGGHFMASKSNAKNAARSGQTSEKISFEGIDLTFQFVSLSTFREICWTRNFHATLLRRRTLILGYRNGNDQYIHHVARIGGHFMASKSNAKKTKRSGQDHLRKLVFRIDPHLNLFHLR
jgi:hypothetical protein